LADGKNILANPQAKGVRFRRLALSPDGKKALASGYSKRVVLWDLEAKKQLDHFDKFPQQVNAARFLDSDRFAAAGNEGSIHIASLKEKKVQQSLPGHIGPVLDLAVSPDGKFLLSAGQDGSTRLWDLGKAKDVQVFKPGDKRVNA